jgi:hypothetical protein
VFVHGDLYRHDWDGGLSDGLKKALPERALNAEVDHYLDAS